ncbi:hypothetical protein V8E36_009050 [Tilletia maclaganii]
MSQQRQQGQQHPQGHAGQPGHGANPAYLHPPGASGPAYDNMMMHQPLYAAQQLAQLGPEGQMFAHHPSQQQPHGVAGGARPPSQPMPGPPVFHHPQMSSGGPYGPQTPGLAGVGPQGGYFGGPAFDPSAGARGMQSAQAYMAAPQGHQSQHAMMMPPTPGAMGPAPNDAGRHGLSDSGDTHLGLNVGMGMGGLDSNGQAQAGPSHGGNPAHEGVATGLAVALPPIASKGTSDFVRKLFNMLDDELYEPIVSWGPTGDSFVVKNMNDFTKHVLPRHFRHSNFASFVRQLNKYDFHKVKVSNGSDDMDPMANISASGDQIWEFKHPEFLRGHEELLENVKRKAPTTKKVGKGTDDRDGSPPPADKPTELATRAAEGYTELKGQIASLTAVQDQMNKHINGLTKQYQGIIGEMLTFQRNMVQQDQLMQNLIQYLMNMENDRGKDGAQPKLEDGGSGSRQRLPSSDGPFLGPSEARKIIGSYADVARASFSQMSEITKRIQSAQQDLQNDAAASSSASVAPTTAIQELGPLSTSTDKSGRSPRSTTGTSPEDAFTPAAGSVSGADSSVAQRRHGFSIGSAGSGSPQPTMYLHPPHFNDDGAGELFNPSAAFGAGPLGSMETAGLRVFTVGTLQPREDVPTDEYLNYGTPAGSRSAEAGGSSNPAVGKAGTPQGPTAAQGASPDGNGESSDGSKLRVLNLEELPESMPKLDRRTSLLPGGLSPVNKSPSPVAGSDSPNSSDANIPTIPHFPGDGAGGSFLRVRRSTYVPGWAVPPRVLLVDDDAVCRKLSSKFLQVFGCAIDVAVDGVNAVNKMNLEKYDLVLMDIVMPNLDGVSATSLIRQFDPRTPIISMTSNSQPNELLTYMQNGMTDVLPKPFTKEGLLNMLEKHLIHLKTVSQMEQIPRHLGLPSLPEGALQNMLSGAAGLAPGLAGFAPGAAGSSAASGSELRLTAAGNNGEQNGNGDGSMNPLASLGFSDTEYISMLQNFIASGSVTDSSQGEMTSSLAQAVGASLSEGQGGARRPSSAILPGSMIAGAGATQVPIPGARKRRSDKLDQYPGHSSDFGTAPGQEPGPSAQSQAASAAPPSSRKRQKMATTG